MLFFMGLELRHREQALVGGEWKVFGEFVLEYAMAVSGEELQVRVPDREVNDAEKR